MFSLLVLLISSTGFSCVPIWWNYIINIIHTKLIDQDFRIVQTTLPFAISIEKTTNLLCRTFNFSVIVLSFSFIVFLLFCIISLVNQLATLPPHFYRLWFMIYKFPSLKKDKESPSWMIQLLSFGFVPETCLGTYQTFAMKCFLEI